MHILVIDDNESVLNALALILEHDGFKVTAAENGREALDLLDEIEPDLILLDLWMPEIDGWQFLIRLRQDGRFGEVPIVVMTADSRDIEAGLRVDGFLRKPLDLDLLLESVKRHLP